MNEKELINNLKSLKKIQPKKDWVVLTKKRILGDSFAVSPSFNLGWALRWRPVYAGILTVLIVFGVLSFVFVEKSLPGDLLYSIRNIVDKGFAMVMSAQDKPAYQLKLANDRLQDLAKAPGKNLAPTINEFHQSVSDAAKSLSKIATTTSSPAVINQIVQETKKLEDNKQKVESLGVVIDEKDTNELDAALGQVTENLIKDLEGRTLTDEQTNILNKMKELFDTKKYSEALEIYLINQNQ